MPLALKLALSPLLLAQALHTRWRLPRLPEAEGPREGVVGRGSECGLLILGDSSAAGVGVQQQHQALAGQLSRALAQCAGRRVRWQLRARSGITSAQALALLREAPAAAAEVAVVATGVNDVVDQVRPAVALQAREALRQALAAEFGVRHVVWTPLPPMHRFAGLPQPLRWVAGQDAQAHDQALARWVAGQAGMSSPRIELPLQADALAADGFHPGEAVYRVWGAALAVHIAEQVLPAL